MTIPKYRKKKGLPDPLVYLPVEDSINAEIKYINKEFSKEKFELPDGRYTMISFNHEYDLLVKFNSDNSYSPNTILEKIIREDINLGFFPKKAYGSAISRHPLSDGTIGQLFNKLETDHVMAIFEFRKNKIRNIFLDPAAMDYKLNGFRKRDLRFYGINLGNYIEMLNDNGDWSSSYKFFFRAINSKKISFIASSGFARNFGGFISWKGKGDFNEIKSAENYMVSEKSFAALAGRKFFKRHSFEFLNSKRHGKHLKFSAYGKVLEFVNYRDGAKHGWHYCFHRKSNIDDSSISSENKISSEDIRKSIFYINGKISENPFVIASNLKEI